MLAEDVEDVEPVYKLNTLTRSTRRQVSRCRGMIGEGQGRQVTIVVNVEDRRHKAFTCCLSCARNARNGLPAPRLVGVVGRGRAAGGQGRGVGPQVEKVT